MLGKRVYYSQLLLWSVLSIVGLLSARSIVGSQAGTGTSYLPLITKPPLNLDLVGQIGGHSLAVAVQGDRAYVGVGPRLVILDVSNPASPTVVGRTAVQPGVASGVVIHGPYAYVAHREAGLRIIDISNPAAPQEVGIYNTTGRAYDVTVIDTYAYIADGEAGLRVVDISNPAAPQEVGFYDTTGRATGVAISGPYAAIADGDAGLQVIDISNPATPQEVDFYDTGGFTLRVVVSESLIHVADGHDGLFILQFAP